MRGSREGKERQRGEMRGSREGKGRTGRGDEEEQRRQRKDREGR